MFGRDCEWEFIMMKAIDRNKFGSFLKNMRERRDVTQADLARKLGFGTSQFISNWERGICEPPMYAIPIIAEYLAIPKRKMVSELLELTKSSLERRFQGHKVWRSKSS
jgi:transcriptional regulator with XRE-family HTH domain